MFKHNQLKNKLKIKLKNKLNQDYCVASHIAWQTKRLHGAKVAIVGCGDVGERLFKFLKSSKVLALGRTPLKLKLCSNTAAIKFITLDLDAPSTPWSRANAKRYAALAPWVIYLAPPAPTGVDDCRLKRFLASSASTHAGAAVNFKNKKQKKRWVYVSTTGVYGSANHDWVYETTPLRATEPRSLRRIAAERRVRASSIAHATILRAPGIYALERLPLARLQQRLPVFNAADDVPTNHIHADDLARLCWLALFKSNNRRVYNAADGQPMPHAQYLCQVAARFNLPMPPSLPWHGVQAALSPMAWSMLSAARKINSQRLLYEWQIKLQYPSINYFLNNLIIK